MLNKANLPNSKTPKQVYKLLTFFIQVCYLGNIKTEQETEMENKKLQLALISTDPDTAEQALELANEFSQTLAKANPNNSFTKYADQMFITADLIRTWNKRYESLAVEIMNLTDTNSLFTAVDRKHTADINRLAYSVVLARLVKLAGIAEMITGE